jgi:ElaB/YqjD/DUF883 family membrane-anchored ribosome-binding protein
VASRTEEEVSSFAPKINGAIDEVKSRAESAASSVSDATSRATESARKAASVAREQAGVAADELKAGAQAVANFASSQPMASLAIAGTIGLLAGLLIARRNT